jgi:Domain of unknown function (DUF4349)
MEVSMSAMRRFGVVPAAVIVVSGLVGAAAGCSGGSGSAGGGGGVSSPAAHAAGAANDGVVLGTLAPDGGQAPGKSAGGAAEPANVASEPLKLPTLPSAVIKTGNLRLRVDHGQFGRTVHAVRDVAQRFGGYPTRSSTTGSKIHEGTITIRVPARAFNDALNALEAISHVHVGAESVTGQDVGQEFVDLRARLVNLRAQEKVLLRLMDQAQTIADSIRVETYLQNVELQIEDVQGRILYLQNRTSMSTIRIALHEAGQKPAPPQHASAIWKAGERSLDAALAVVTSVIVGAGLVLPVSILALLALLVARRLAPLVRGLRARPTAGSSAPDES